MVSDIKSYISRVIPELEESLITIKSRKSLGSLLSNILKRQHITSVFEFSINNNLGYIDFAYAVSKDEDYEFLSQLFSKKNNLIKLLNFGKLNPLIKGTWFELDSLRDEGYSEPCLFYSLKEGVSLEFIEKAISILSLNNKINYSEKIIAECFNNLSGEQYIEHLGVMNSRATKTIRFYIHGLNKFSALTYLKSIRIDCDLKKIENILTQFSEINFQIVLSIEFNGKLHENVSFEFHFENDQHEMLFLEKMYSIGFISKNVNILKSMLKKHKFSFEEKNYYCRSLSHMKLNFNKNVTTSKMYLQIAPDYLKAIGF